MKNKILIAAALFVSANFLQSCGNSNSNKANNEMDTSMDMAQSDSMSSGKMQMPAGGDNGMMQSMSGMMGQMKDMKMTGDFDLDFANMMIMHHQGAIDMSEVEIAKGADAQLKTLAQNIITAQKSEIERLQQFIKSYKMTETKKETDEMHNELSETMKAGMEKMRSMPMTGNTDKDYAAMMIPHHESAVTMAKNELSHGKELGLKKMAQQMIADQNKEIAEFKSWIDKQK